MAFKGGFSGSDKPKASTSGNPAADGEKGKGTAGGSAGTQALMQGGTIRKNFGAGPGAGSDTRKEIANNQAQHSAMRATRAGEGSGGSDLSEAPKATNYPLGVSKQYSPGAVGYYSDPSWGQILGTTLPALVPGGGVLNNAQSIAKGKFSTQNTGGLLGEGIDSLMGQKPGVQTGWSADPSMTPGRDRAQRGTKRESFDQTTIGSATGTASDDEASKPVARPTDDFSDIQMMDRRKPGLKQMLETML